MASRYPNSSRGTKPTPVTPRLPSLRPVRDLTLGGGTTSISTAPTPNSTPTNTPSQSSTKPKFTPNLAAAGRRQIPNTPPTESPCNSESGSKRGRGGRQDNQRGFRGRGGGRGRGRGGRYEPEIIQSKGIFSEGLAEADPGTKLRNSDADSGYSKRQERVESFKDRQKKAKDTGNAMAIETDEEALKNLLKDDFVAHRRDTNRVKPVVLPLNTAPSVPFESSVKKMDLMDVDDDNTDIKLRRVNRLPTTFDQRNAFARISRPSVRMPTLAPVFEEIFGTTEDKSHEGSLFFVQLPNILSDVLVAGNAQEMDSTNVAVKDEPMDVDDHVSAAYPKGVSVKTELGQENTEEIIADETSTEQRKPKGALHSISGIPQGRIGKLQLMKSGRVRLKLNEPASQKPLILDATPGTKTGFLQQAVSIKIRRNSEDPNDETGQLYVLGNVSHRLMFTPKVDHLLRGLKRH